MTPVLLGGVLLLALSYENSDEPWRWHPLQLDYGRCLESDEGLRAFHCPRKLTSQ